jgi:sugar lactone lactonase YvrE
MGARLPWLWLPLIAGGSRQRPDTRLPISRVLALILFVVAAAALPSSAPLATMFAPENLLVRTGADGVVELDATTGAFLGTFTTDLPNDMVFHGGRLYTTDPSDFIRVYDSLSGALLDSLAGPGLLMNPGAIAFSPSGEIIVLNRKSGQITLDRFDLAGDLLGTLATGPFNDFTFGENGNIFATTASDEIVELDGGTGALVATLVTGLMNPGPLVFLPDGTLLVRDASGLLQFTDTGVSLGLFNSALSNDLAVGPDGNLYTTDPSDAVLVYDSGTGVLQGTFSLTPMNPSALAFRPIPEPSTALLLALGLMALAGGRRRR